MDKETQLKESFTKAVGVLEKFKATYDATITELDEGEYTCTAETVSGATFGNVPFAVLTNSFSTFRIIPSIGSSCVLGFREGNQARPELLKVDKFDKIIFFDGTVGVPLTPNLVDRLNKVENLLNEFIANYNLHTHNVVSIGSPTATPLPIESNTATLTTNKDIASTQIFQ
jgi:hypothetical protein